MLDLLLHNYLLWINICIPIFIGIFLYITHKEYSLREFFIQSIITMLVLLLAFFIGYNVSDISTKSYKNTKIVSFIYEEEWTERVTYSESYKCGKRTCYRTKTRYDNHPDYYYIKSSFGDKSISKSDYEKARRDFTEQLIDSGHIDQVSFNDGRTFKIIPSKNIVLTDYDTEINYIYASKTNIIKSGSFKDIEEKFKDEIKEYPEIIRESEQYGTRNFRRVINSNLISEEVALKLQRDLEELSIDLNANANPIIYLTTASREFAYVIKGYYKDKYFNDAMLVVGVKDNKILWTEPVSISKSAEFKVYATNLTDNFQDLIPKFSNVLKTHWVKPDLNDYKYLASDIDLPLWYEIIIVMINIVGSFIAFRFMLNNRI